MEAMPRRAVLSPPSLRRLSPEADCQCEARCVPSVKLQVVTVRRLRASTLSFGRDFKTAIRPPVAGDGRRWRRTVHPNDGLSVSAAPMVGKSQGLAARTRADQEIEGPPASLTGHDGRFLH